MITEAGSLGAKPVVLSGPVEVGNSCSWKAPSNIRVCSVTPAFNEAETIADIISRLREYVDVAFLVDDGSTDGTAEIAESAGAEVIRHGENRGPGAAMETGYAHAITKDFDFVVQIDGDGQHDPRYIPELLRKAVLDDCDVVIGSRFLNESHKEWPFIRRMGIIFFTRLVNILGGVRLTDVASGFKVHRVKSLSQLGEASDRFPAAEQILRYAKRGMKIREVSIQMPLRQTSQSYLNPARLAIYPFLVTFSLLRVKLIG